MSEASVDTPEFQIVVKRPGGRGPLAPYRFAITFMFVALVCGRSLLMAAETGHGVDGALLRCAGAGLFAWLVLGRISKILSAPARPPTRPAPTGSSNTE